MQGTSKLVSALQELHKKLRKKCLTKFRTSDKLNTSSELLNQSDTKGGKHNGI
nr:MAG TPA: hypothetical protein [Caudoviricetes sp.]